MTHRRRTKHQASKGINQITADPRIPQLCTTVLPLRTGEIKSDCEKQEYRQKLRAGGSSKVIIIEQFLNIHRNTARELILADFAYKPFSVRLCWRGLFESEQVGTKILLKFPDN